MHTEAAEAAQLVVCHRNPKVNCNLRVKDEHIFRAHNAHLLESGLQHAAECSLMFCAIFVILLGKMHTYTAFSQIMKNWAKHVSLFKESLPTPCQLVVTLLEVTRLDCVLYCQVG